MANTNSVANFLKRVRVVKRTHLNTPTALRPLAQGWRRRRLPWVSATPKTFNPNGVAPNPRHNEKQIYMNRSPPTKIPPVICRSHRQTK